MFKKIFILLLLFCLVIIISYPFIFLFMGSFMGTDELKQNLGAVLKKGTVPYIQWSFIPMYPTLKSYVKLLIDTPEYFKMFWNSIKISFFILLGQLIIATPCSWGISQGKIRRKKLLFSLYIVLMLLPFQILMLPEYLVLNKMNLLDTYSSVIIPNIFSTFPVFIMSYFFKIVPKGIIEAARIDGANELWIFLKIGLPLAKSGVVSALLLSFFESWNLIEQPLLFLEDKTKWPLSIQLSNIAYDQADIAIVSSVITLILPIIVFITFQDELEKGIGRVVG